MRRSSYDFSEKSWGSILVTLLITGALGGMSLEYILSWFGKTAPTLLDFVLGVFGYELTIPVALMGWILKCFGVF